MGKAKRKRLVPPGHKTKDESTFCPIGDRQGRGRHDQERSGEKKDRAGNRFVPDPH
jgi:hypothetical protein